MTSTTDTWILVAVPGAARRRGEGSRLLDRIAVRGGLGLLAWADRPRTAPRSVDLGRVERVTAGPRPFC